MHHRKRHSTLSPLSAVWTMVHVTFSRWFGPFWTNRDLDWFLGPLIG